MEEKVVNNLHFIWVGGSIPGKYLDNINNWVNVNQTCPFNIYLWYDSKFSMTDEIIESQIELLNSDNNVNRIWVVDIRASLSDVLDRNPELEKFYEMEVGLQSRPLNIVGNNKVRNWGLGTDIIRLLILSKYGGFYCDVDIVPIDLCKYRGVCELKFCANNIDEVPINNVLYYDIRDNQATKLITEYLNNILSRYRTFYNNELKYLTTDYESMTLNTTGPKNFPNRGTKESLLQGFSEHPQLGAEHSWFIIPETKAEIWYKIITTPELRAKYLSEFYGNENARELFNLMMSQKESSKSVDEEDLEGEIRKILRKLVLDRSDKVFLLNIGLERVDQLYKSGEFGTVYNLYDIRIDFLDLMLRDIVENTRKESPSGNIHSLKSEFIDQTKNIINTICSLQDLSLNKFTAVFTTVKNYVETVNTIPVETRSTLIPSFIDQLQFICYN